MFLTSENLVGGRDLRGIPENLSFINEFSWQSSKHMKEAIKILLSARLDEKQEFISTPRFEHETAGEFEEVQSRLAGNPETSSEVLNYLARVGKRCICERVASNPRCTEETLSLLSKHRDADVRAAVSENENCPFPVLSSLAKDENPDVRYRIAENANLSVSILEELSEDENPYVADRAASTLKRLRQGEVLEVSSVFRQKIQPLRIRH